MNVSGVFVRLKSYCCKSSPRRNSSCSSSSLWRHLTDCRHMCVVCKVHRQSQHHRALESPCTSPPCCHTISRRLRSGQGSICLDTTRRICTAASSPSTRRQLATPIFCFRPQNPAAKTRRCCFGSMEGQ